MSGLVSLAAKDFFECFLSHVAPSLTPCHLLTLPAHPSLSDPSLEGAVYPPEYPPSCLIYPGLANRLQQSWQQ